MSEQRDAGAAALRAGVASVDITPPLEVGLLTSSVKETWAPFESVRRPLKARVVVLESAERRVGLLSLDLLGLSDTAVGGWDAFKEVLAGSLGAENLLLCSTHTHNAPESVALTELYTTPAYRRWLSRWSAGVARAVDEASASLRPCRLLTGSGILEGHSLQRRIPSAAGIIMSDSIQPIAPEHFLREPVDRRVRVMRLVAEEGPAIATLVHAVCHPVHEMCLPHVSADFPGEMCDRLDGEGDGGMTLFLNGSAGDTNPPTVSEGEVCARDHGHALAQTVQQALRPGGAGAVQLARGEGEAGVLKLSARDVMMTARPEAGTRSPGECLARLRVLAVGPVALVFLPGEPFIETALAIERDSPFPQTLVVGFAESSIGYVPPRRAFEEGGYEIGPGKWSYLTVEAESILTATAGDMLRELSEF